MLPTGWASSSFESICPPNGPRPHPERRNDYEVSLQRKNARVKLLIQTKFALNMAKMASLFAMTMQQLTRKPKHWACQYHISAVGILAKVPSGFTSIVN